MAGRPRTTGKRLAFPDPLASDFLDFAAPTTTPLKWKSSAKRYGSTLTGVSDTEPELRKRFDAARRKRLGLNGDKIRLLPTSK
jgi:hypothetical protein